MTDLTDIFPNLNSTNFKITSPYDGSYNCIAWAAEDEEYKWWPDQMKQYYWPRGAPRIESTDAFIETFSRFGYEVCESRQLETGTDKIAIYTINGIPKHMARQLKTGDWTSKCGDYEDISHELGWLEGDEYGKVTVVMKRPRKPNNTE